MLQAIDAGRLSRRGLLAEERQDEERERVQREQWLAGEAEAIPSRLTETERIIKLASGRGERKAHTHIFLMQGSAYEGELKRESLCKPHQDLLAKFEQAGYKVHFRFDFEPDRNAEWYEIILKW